METLAGGSISPVQGNHRSSALFFTRFDFTVSYRPGDKNIKVDALSRLHQPDPEDSSHEPILPPAMIISPIQWAIDEQITQATRSNPALPGGPEGLLYVPLIPLI